MDLLDLQELFDLKTVAHPETQAPDPNTIADVLADGLDAPVATPMHPWFPLQEGKRVFFHTAAPRALIPDVIDAAPKDGHRWIIVSFDQLQSGILSPQRYYLAPIVEALAVHRRFVRELTVVSPLIGTIRVAPHPDGRFEVTVDFDAPDALGARLHHLRTRLEKIRTHPGPTLRDRKVLKALTKESSALRRALGALARYHGDPPPRLHALVDGWTDETQKYPVFHFSTPDHGRLSFALDGPVTLRPKDRSGFMTFDQCEALGDRLVELGLVTFRQDRVDRARALAEKAPAGPERTWLLDQLRRARPSPALPSVIRDLAFASDNPLVMHGFARRSVFRAVRLYHDPPALCSAWQNSRPAEQRRLARRIAAVALPYFGAHPTSDRWLLKQNVTTLA